MFESTENQFQNSFFVKSMRLAATENRFSRKSFPFDQNFTLLTRKSFYIVVLPLNDFRKKHKREREPQKEKTHANKTQTAQERENDRRLSRSWSPELRRSELIAIVIDALCDRDLAIDASRDLAIEIGEIAIAISLISCKASIVISRSIAISLIAIVIAISPRKCDLFWVLFVFLGMNDIMYSFGNWENVSNK